MGNAQTNHARTIPSLAETARQADLSTGMAIMFLRILGVSLGNTPEEMGRFKQGLEEPCCDLEKLFDLRDHPFICHEYDQVVVGFNHGIVVGH